jgi:perosamine synthetase
VLRTLSESKGAPRLKIPVSKPFLDNRELKSVKKCVNSGWISSSGEYLELFEAKLKDFFAVEHVVCTNNGTTALHLALEALRVQPGDEVLVPNVTYVATANAVKYCGGIPVLVDVMPHSLNIDFHNLESYVNDKTKGIIVVHLYGQPCEMNEILRFARKKGLWVLEDSAEAYGATYNGKRVSSFGDIATLSFYGNKIITTGEGGAVLTNNSELASRARLLRGQGMDPAKRFWFTEIGFNYRMTNLAASIGVAQMEKYQYFNNDRDRIYSEYSRLLSSVRSVITPFADTVEKVSSKWLYTIFLSEESNTERDTIIKKLELKGIETRPVFYPISDLPPYESQKNLPVSKNWSYRGISLPTFVGLKRKEIEYIVEELIVNTQIK